MPRIRSNQSNRPGLNFWQGICKGWPNVNENLIWKVGSGARVNLETDLWVPNMAKLEGSASAVNGLSLVESVAYVKDMGVSGMLSS